MTGKQQLILRFWQKESDWLSQTLKSSYIRLPTDTEKEEEVWVIKEKDEDTKRKPWGENRRMR